MSQDGMTRLEEVVRAVVTDAEGTSGPAMAALAAELRTRPKTPPGHLEGTQRPGLSITGASAGSGRLGA